MRQCTITMSTPWSRRVYSTSLYIKLNDATNHIGDAIRRYAKKHGVSVLAVDYSLNWGAV